MSGKVVTFKQDEIFLNGKRVGYVGHGPGEPINLLEQLDEKPKAELEALVAERRGTAAKRVNVAPGVPEELEKETDDE